jgi:hypothetical protein
MLTQCGGNCITERKVYQWVEMFQSVRTGVGDGDRAFIGRATDRNSACSIPHIDRNLQKVLLWYVAYICVKNIMATADSSSSTSMLLHGLRIFLITLYNGVKLCVVAIILVDFCLIFTVIHQQEYYRISTVCEWSCFKIESCGIIKYTEAWKSPNGSEGRQSEQ